MERASDHYNSYVASLDHVLTMAQKRVDGWATVCMCFDPDPSMPMLVIKNRSGDGRYTFNPVYFFEAFKGLGVVTQDMVLDRCADKYENPNDPQTYGNRKEIS